MRSGLILTHYSLLAIAIISSCFLFYLVASETARNAAATTQSHELSDVHQSALNVDEIGAKVANENEATSTSNSKDNAAKLKIIRNYKKLKKSKSNSLKTADASPLTRIFISEESSDVSAINIDSNEQTTSYVRNPAIPLESKVLSIDKNVIGDKAKNVESAGRGIRDNINNIYGDYSLVSRLSVSEAKSDKDNDARGSVEENNHKKHTSLPNIITDIPAVTVTELPLEVLQPMRSSLNAIIVDASHKNSNAQDAENSTVEILEDNDNNVQTDDQIIKINDSGGENVDQIVSQLPVAVTISNGVDSPTDRNVNEESISTGSTPPAPPSASVSISATEDQQQKPDENTTADTGSGTVNPPNEEVPMPVFSEWAQKQMEAAEKQQQAKDQEVVNTITQKKNLTNGSKKLPPLKMRAKNYASPDCGAKIIATNSDASNTGAVLSSSKDEYMLSPCGNRIWFVVELCEAIQAQKVDLANFELFSSSPKNFTVAVSNRFPTRDWSNVGRFVAEDKRNVQSFDLHPHLFGKFVRVDIHSHHSQEHFCPVSLFRVFGTSEIEAFETENHPDDELEDFDDEFEGGVAIEQANIKNSDNIFKSASDAVLSMVKKAAEVLVKPSNTQNQTLNTKLPLVAVNRFCRSPVYGQFTCTECAPSLVERVNDVMSCEFRQLENLLNVHHLRKDLLSTQVCTKSFGVEAKVLINDCSLYAMEPQQLDVKKSYFINLLPEEYVGALCYALSGSTAIGSEHTTVTGTNTIDSGKDNEVALNLTIDKKLKTGEFENLNEGTLQRKNQIKHPNIHSEIEISSKPAMVKQHEETTEKVTEPSSTVVTTNPPETDQVMRPPEDTQAENIGSTISPTKTQDPSTLQPSVAPDVNIFNEPPKAQEEAELHTTTENIVINPNVIDSSTELPITEIPPLSSTESITKSEEDNGVNGAWDSLDTLLPTTLSPGGNNQGLNLQQKIPGTPQSESVFIRLSNRIKALERNMSLSGQYLEELSRRYKKQVEELQQILTQQSQTVRNLEDQNRHHLEMQDLFEQSNVLLKNELDNMALQLHACIVVIIVVGAFVLLLLVTSVLFFRAIWRQNRTLHKSTTTGNTKKDNSSSCNRKKLLRRKSFDDYSHCVEKLRRPSEEAMDILKNHLEVPEHHLIFADKMVQTQPQRKISVCYGNNSNEFVMNSEIGLKNRNSLRRKGAKNSWSNPTDTRQLALDRLENMRGMDITLEEFEKFAEREKNQKLKSNQLLNGQGKWKKRPQNFRRQESAPAQCNNSSTSKINTTQSNDYGENLLLDEEDLDNFIPNADLAYNEFMPEGPSGYQIVVDDNEKPLDDDQSPLTNSTKGTDKSGKKKTRRLSSSGFFKSPFGKALKGKSSSVGNGNTSIVLTPPHSSATSWEWHRLKNQDLAKNSHDYTAPASFGLSRGSPTHSLDASTLSEIHFPTNSNENSFRILEEAILSSGETINRSPTAEASNGKHSHSTTSSISGGSGGSNSSQRSTASISTTSSTSNVKKKQRSFNRIFRKVF